MTRRVTRNMQPPGPVWKTNWNALPKYVNIDPVTRFKANSSPALRDYIPCDYKVLRRCAITVNQDVVVIPQRGYDPCAVDDSCDCLIEPYVFYFDGVEDE